MPNKNKRKRVINQANINDKPVSINDLPMEVLDNIFQQVMAENLKELPLVNNFWNSTFTSEVLWRRKYEQYFSHLPPLFYHQTESGELTGRFDYFKSFQNRLLELKKYYQSADDGAEKFRDTLSFRVGNVEYIEKVIYRWRFCRQDNYGFNFIDHIKVLGEPHRQRCLDTNYKIGLEDGGFGDPIRLAAICNQLKVIRGLGKQVAGYAEKMAKISVKYNYEDLFFLVNQKYLHLNFSQVAGLLYKAIIDLPLNYLKLSPSFAKRLFNMLRLSRGFKQQPTIHEFSEAMKDFMGCVTWPKPNLAKLGLFFWAVVLDQKDFIASYKITEFDQRILLLPSSDYRKKCSLRHYVDFIMHLYRKGCVFHQGFTRAVDVINYDTRSPNDNFFCHPLYGIVASERLDFVRELCLDINTTAGMKRYLLEVAAILNKTKLFELLLYYGAEIDQYVVAAAFRFEAREILKIIASDQCHHPLITNTMLVMDENPVFFSFLATKGFNFNRIGEDERKSPFMLEILEAIVKEANYLSLSTCKDLLDCFRVAIEAGANPEIQDARGRTLLKAIEEYSAEKNDFIIRRLRDILAPALEKIEAERFIEDEYYRCLSM